MFQQERGRGWTWTWQDVSFIERVAAGGCRASWPADFCLQLMVSSLFFFPQQKGETSSFVKVTVSALQGDGGQRRDMGVSAVSEMPPVGDVRP